jgi:hypothetical protein
VLKLLAAVTVVFSVSFAVGYAAVAFGKAYAAYRSGLVECINRVDNTKILDLPIRLTICRDRDSADEPWSDWRVMAANKGFSGYIYILDANLPD